MEKKELKKKQWIVVVNKWTYLFFLSIPIGLLKIAFYDITLYPNYNNFAVELMISIIIMIIGIYFFLRFNTYSNIFNPNHPHGDML